MFEILNKIRSKFAGSAAGGAAAIAVTAERRSDQRYDLSDFSGIMTTFPTGHTMKLSDISYGGLRSNSMPAGLDQTLFKNGGPATLIFLGRSCKVRLALVFHRDDAIGFSFVHTDATALLFLRTFLESMRHGSSVIVLGSDVVHEKYRDERWTVMRGDGPIDIILESKDGTTLDSGLLTFMRDNVYCELSNQARKMKTGQTIDERGLASRMSVSEKIDQEILRAGIHILIGAYTYTKNAVLGSWIKAAIAELEA